MSDTSVNIVERESVQQLCTTLTQPSKVECFCPRRWQGEGVGGQYVHPLSVLYKYT